MLQVFLGPDPALLPCAVCYGSWFQHVKDWLSCQEEMNLFCVTYEELHQVSDSFPLRPALVNAGLKA